MSLSEVQRFYHQLKTEQSLAEAYQHALQGIAEEQQERATLRFARQQGFEFSRVELRVAKRKAQTDKGFTTQRAVQQPALSVNSLERFFIWLSGASPKILATCPDSEQKKHAALGGTVLIPALFSTVTSSFLLFSLGDFDNITIILIAVLWMLIVLLMDRALLATYRKSFSAWTTIRQFGLRFLIALLIAFTVAHPVILLLFSGTINEEYDKSKLAKYTQLTQQYQKQNTLLNEQIKEQQDLLKSNSHFEPPICINHNNTDLATNSELTQLEAKKVQARENIKLFRQNAEDERNGVVKEGLTGHKGCKKESECRAWIHKANEEQEQVNNLERNINKIKTIISHQVAEQQQTLARQCHDERQSWAKQMLAQNELAQKKLDALINQSRELDKHYSSDNTSISALKPDILKQTKILHSIMGLNSIEAAGNLLLFLAFMLLFLLIDMLAVLLKLTSTGIYETKVDIEEYYNSLLYFIAKRQYTALSSAELIAAERKIIDTISLPSLKHELSNSLETLISLLANADNYRQQRFFKLSAQRDNKKTLLNK